MEKTCLIDAEGNETEALILSKHSLIIGGFEAILYTEDKRIVKAIIGDDDFCAAEKEVIGKVSDLDKEFGYEIQSN